MKYVRKLSAIGLSSVLAVSLAACGVKEEAKAPNNAGTSGEQKAVKLRIMWWGSQARHDATLKALDLYTKKNPNVTFEPEYQGWDGYLDKISTMAAARNLPDIIQTDAAWIADWGSTNRLMDLTGAINTKDVDPALLNTGKYKDKLFAIPLGNNAFGLVYNKAELEKLGITPPKYGWTWDDFFKFAKEAKAKLGKNQYAFKDLTADGLYDAYQLAKGKGWPRADGKFNYDKETWLDWMKKFAEMRAAGIVPPADVTISDKGADAKLDLMIQDKILLRNSHAAEFSGFDALKPGQLALVTIPQDKQAGGWLKASMYWSVSPDTKQAEAAKKFMDWFINDPEAADILGTSRGVPVSKQIVTGLESKFTPTDKAAIELINKTAPHAQVFYPGPGLKNGWDKFEKEYSNLVQQIMFDKITPEKAWEQIEKLGKEIK